MSCPTLPIDRLHPWLAPLAGFSDLAFRLLCREYGASVCVTEMVSAKGLVYASPGSRDLLSTSSADLPLVAQLFGAEAPFLAKAVSMLRKKGFVWFDLNMGCSVRKVLRQGAGAAMLNDPDNALAAARAMIHAAEPGTVGFKLRLFPGEERGPFSRLREFSLRLQDEGAGWLTLHPRTAAQAFSGNANRDALEELASCLSIPLLASGDLMNAREGLRCLESTGVSGLMYARGALRDPIIFEDHLRLCRNAPPRQRRVAVLRDLALRHIRLARELSSGLSALWKMRTVIPRYARGLPGARALRDRLCRCTDWPALEEAVEEALDISCSMDENRSSNNVKPDRSPAI
ncbi:MAG: tRNA-dihydrouridine synthase family protein [Desulfovibrio sp.]|jgi:tRNA-dihydrouridine synthase B|nr:tRNA-dihydrouridine synthase family protein [Desulfovibrio sp.]